MKLDYIFFRITKGTNGNNMGDITRNTLSKTSCDIFEAM